MYVIKPTYGSPKYQNLYMIETYFFFLYALNIAKFIDFERYSVFSYFEIKLPGIVTSCVTCFLELFSYCIGSLSYYVLN